LNIGVAVFWVLIAGVHASAQAESKMPHPVQFTVMTFNILQDRIYFAGAGLAASGAAVVGESRDACEIVYRGQWPSDHRAVVATFTMEAAPPRSTGEKPE